MDYSGLNVPSKPRDSAWYGMEGIAELICMHVSPKIVVDIGTYKGYSATVFSKNIKGDVYTIDPNKEEVAEKLFKAEYPNIHYIVDTSMNVLSKWDKEVQIVHIDGSHESKDVIDDIRGWKKFLAPGGVMLAHDICNWSYVGRQVNTAMREVMNEFPHTLAFIKEAGMAIMLDDAYLANQLRMNFDVMSYYGFSRLKLSMDSGFVLSRARLKE